MCDAFTAVLFLKHKELVFLRKLRNIVLSNILMKLRQKKIVCFLFSYVYVKQKSLRSLRPAKKRPVKGR
jgi:hypothetical protein